MNVKVLSEDIYTGYNIKYKIPLNFGFGKSVLLKGLFLIVVTFKCVNYVLIKKIRQRNNHGDSDKYLWRLFFSWAISGS